MGKTKLERDYKRVLISADWHTGHQVGLTPPCVSIPAFRNERHRKYSRTRMDLWNHFKEIVNDAKPIDVLILNGDVIDGKGARSGGTELLIPDRNVQIDAAIEIIKYIDAPVIRLTYGTDYHTSGGDGGEDWEDVLIGKLQDRYDVKVGSHEWYEINGTIFDVKHHLNRSSVPYGKSTPLLREVVHNRMWASRGEQPKADVLIRSHNHYYTYSHEDNCLAISTPSLQGYGSKYGSRRMSGTIDLGVLIFDCHESGTYSWRAELIHGKTQVARSESL